MFKQILTTSSLIATCVALMTPMVGNAVSGVTDPGGPMVLKVQNGTNHLLEIEKLHWNQGVCSGRNFSEMGFQPGQLHEENVMCRGLTPGVKVVTITTERSDHLGHYCTWGFYHDGGNLVSRLDYKLLRGGSGCVNPLKIELLYR